jgi:ABC-type uncharacterized transport system permease subunit
MILSTGSAALAQGAGMAGAAPDAWLAGGWALALAAAAAYAVAASWSGAVRVPVVAFALGAVLHFVLLVADIGGFGSEVRGARLGFAPVLSLTVWLVIAVHAVESRMLPLPAVRRVLATMGALAVVVAAAFPGEPRSFASPLAPLHLALGIASYALFAIAVLHAVWLDTAERQLRGAGATAAPGAPRRLPQALGMPLLKLEGLTFRFVEAGFAVLTATLLLGVVTTQAWRWDHKTVLSLLGWAVFAALLLGRRLRGWRGSRATRWLYAGALLLLLAYAGSRFVFEVVLGRGAA